MEKYIMFTNDSGEIKIEKFESAEVDKSKDVFVNGHLLFSKTNTAANFQNIMVFIKGDSHFLNISCHVNFCVDCGRIVNGMKKIIKIIDYASNAADPERAVNVPGYLGYICKSCRKDQEKATLFFEDGSKQEATEKQLTKGIEYT